MANVFTIIDDSSESFAYSGGDWTVDRLVQLYGGSSHSFTSSGAFPGGYGSVTLSFEGTSVAFYGEAPSTAHPQTLLVSIDGAPPYSASYGDPSLPPYRQWYQSSQLSNGDHNVTLTNIDGASIDFATVTVGPDTQLYGKTLVVDNDDPNVRYQGNWIRSTAPYQANTLSGGLPFGNTTHRSYAAGDSFAFQFSGTSISVYGMFSWSNLGLLSATYTLDGASLSQTYSVTTGSAEYLNNVGDSTNFLFYSNNTLSPGQHTLVISTTQCTNQSFTLDYITYEPSFPSLAKMPNSSMTTFIKSTPTTQAGSRVNPITTTQSPQAAGSKLPVLAIICGTAAGFIFLLCSGILVFCMLGKRRKRWNAGRTVGYHKYRKSRFPSDSSTPLIEPKSSPPHPRYRSPRHQAPPPSRGIDPFPYSPPRQQTFSPSRGVDPFQVPYSPPRPRTSSPSRGGDPFQAPHSSSRHQTSSPSRGIDPFQAPYSSVHNHRDSASGLKAERRIAERGALATESSGRSRPVIRTDGITHHRNETRSPSHEGPPRSVESDDLDFYTDQRPSYFIRQHSDSPPSSSASHSIFVHQPTQRSPLSAMTSTPPATTTRSHEGEHRLRGSSVPTITDSRGYGIVHGRTRGASESQAGQFALRTENRLTPVRRDPPVTPAWQYICIPAPAQTGHAATSTIPSRRETPNADQRHGNRQQKITGPRERGRMTGHERRNDTNPTSAATQSNRNLPRAPQIAPPLLPPLTPIRRAITEPPLTTIPEARPSLPPLTTSPAYTRVLSIFGWQREAQSPGTSTDESFGNLDVPPAYHTLSRKASGATQLGVDVEAEGR